MTGEPIGTPFNARQLQVLSVDFNSDGKQIVTAGADGSVKLWTVSGDQVGQFVGHQGRVTQVTFSPQGRLIASSGMDGTVRLWLPSGEQVAQFPGYYGATIGEVSGGDFGGAGLAFGPDSRVVAIAENGGAVRLWRIQRLDELIRQGCDWLKPYFDTHPNVAQMCP